MQTAQVIFLPPRLISYVEAHKHQQIQDKIAGHRARMNNDLMKEKHPGMRYLIKKSFHDWMRRHIKLAKFDNDSGPAEN